MSFLSERKAEITDFQYSKCCKRAIINGVIFAKASIEDDLISFNVEDLKTAEYITDLIMEVFQKKSEINTPKSGGRCVTVSFKSASAQKYLFSISTDTKIFYTDKCELCKSAFIKGLFLSCGRIVDPRKQYRLELSPSERAEEILEFLEEHGLHFSLQKRKTENIIYTANSTVIEEFFTHAGMNSTAFLLMNLKIENDFKNIANRIRNCETHNIGKSISASSKFVTAIEALDNANLLSTLPDELEKTARLRLQFKDYSLARLAGEFSPPISKPGLSHRLNRILEIYESLFNNKKTT